MKTKAATLVMWVATLLVFLLPGETQAGILYGIADFGDLYVIDTETGTSTFIGDTVAGNYTMRGLSFDPVVDMLYSVDNHAKLLAIDRYTAAGAWVPGSGGIGGGVSGLAYNTSDGCLYAGEWGFTPSYLYKIDPNTGSNALVGQIDFTGSGSGYVGDLAYDPESNTLFAVSSYAVSKLYIIDPETAATTLIGSTGFGYVVGLAWDPDAQVLYGAADPYHSKTLISIDPMTGAGSLIGATSVGFFGLAVVPEPAAVEMEWVTVGNPGNAADDTGYGSVDYTYRIGKYEVTAGQYTVFLNAVATTDTYGLYDTQMWAHLQGCKIQRNGNSGSYTYSVAEDYANKPVNFVNFGDSARFINWLHNGQPTGAQGLSTTEDGSYYLNRATTTADLMAITRRADATWFLPTEDEWYKAAYHKNDGVTGNYWDYPISSDSISTAMANYGISVGHTTEVGSYAYNSPYGISDMGGNVWEWNEGIVSDSLRNVRGGSFNSDDYAIVSSFRWHDDPYYGDSGLGFRVASVAEPAIEAAIDIDPDTLNLNSKGRWITCYISLPKGYDVADIDPGTVMLEDAVAADWIWFDEEVQAAMAKFSRSAVEELLVELGLLGDIELIVTGELTDGTRFEGRDTIRVIDKGGKKK